MVKLSNNVFIEAYGIIYHLIFLIYNEKLDRHISNSILCLQAYFKIIIQDMIQRMIQFQQPRTKDALSGMSLKFEIY